MDRHVVRRTSLVAVVVLALAGAVAGLASSARADERQPPPDAVEVTNSGNGETLLAAAGQTVIVRLGSDLDWTIAAGDPTVLQPLTPAGGLPDGVQAVFTAANAGVATIHATGTAHCGPGQICPHFAVAFNANLQVLPAGGALVVGPAASGATLTVVQGEEVLFQLNPTFDWSFSYTPSDALQPVADTSNLPLGVQQALIAQQTGSVTVQAFGQPHCNPGQACIALAAVFSTTIQVQPAGG